MVGLGAALKGWTYLLILIWPNTTCQMYIYNNHVWMWGDGSGAVGRINSTSRF